MGIRYYGWAITEDEVTEALQDPRPVIRRADQRYNAPGWPHAATCLDKAWLFMQQLLSPDWPRSRRPGYELVAGDVSYPFGYSKGYEPHIAVLSPDRVSVIARDMASITPSDVRGFCDGLIVDDDVRRRDEVDYLTYYVGVASTFTADAAARECGIVYQIG
jgi:hypothetical protein